MPTQAQQTIAEEDLQQSFDASDPKQVNERRKKEGRKRKKRLDLIAGLMAIAEGREWIYEKLVECKVYAPTFVPNDPQATAFQEGRRSVGLELLADVMDAAEDSFILMCKEAKTRK